MKITGLPTLRDPRLLVFVFFSILDFYALTAPGFARTSEHLFISFGVCVALDLACNLLLKKNVVFPMSAILTANGVFLLVDSPFASATAVAAALSILSKHLFRINGQHIFNPNNFGVAIVCWAFPQYVVTGAHRWAGRVPISLVLVALGTAIVIRVHRWAASYSYLLFFLLFNVARAFYFHKMYWVYSLSLLGPAMGLFVFFMISDPMTSPSDRQRQIVYGAAIALADNVFRQFEFRDAPLFALFLVCLFYNLYRAYRPDLTSFKIWKTRDLEIA